MDRANGSISRSAPGACGVDPVVLGTTCCIVSAIGYSASNICMRQVAALHCDPTWAICVKELVTVLVAGPWMLYFWFRDRSTIPSAAALGVLVLTGLAVQLLGNLGVQWTYGVVGLAITLPITLGVALAGAAVLGRLVLGERVSGVSATAIALLIASIALLSLGAGTAHRAIMAGASHPLLVAWGLGAACTAGAMYAALAVVIRGMSLRGVSVATIVVFITGMGVLSLGALSLARLGMHELINTPHNELAWMLAAGTLNLIAFVAISKGLQLTTVVRANVLNASQVALAALAGMLLFGEPPTRWLIAGIALTIAGMFLVRRPEGV